MWPDYGRKDCFSFLRYHIQYHTMSKWEKLIAGLRNNPKDVRFADACRIAEKIGFTCKGGQGSHNAFQRPGEPTSLNFQDRKGRIFPYQARQLLEMVEKYWDGDNE
jgi:hypothetical protein